MSKDTNKDFNKLIDNSIDTFIRNITSLDESFPLIIITLITTLNKNLQALKKFIKDKKIKRIKKKDGIYILLRDDLVPRFEPIQKKIDDTGTALLIIPKNFVISLIAQFDFFIASLIREMFLIKPELLKIGENSLSYQKIFEFSSIDDARDYLVSDQIDNLLRGGHSELLKWIESRLNEPFIAKLDIWPTFIEVCERRNLFVHADSKITEQYLRVCSSVGVKVSSNKLGDELGVDPKYFVRACFAVLEVGILTSLILRRKLLPSDLMSAEIKLNETCYDLIRNKKYSLAQRLLDFTLEKFEKHGNDELKIVLQINKILTHKLIGNKEKVKELVNSIDWSALHPRYKLAKEILLNNYLDALKSMIILGSKDLWIDKAAYERWPLFADFRNTKEFHTGYKKVFGKKFIKIKESKPLISDLLESTGLNKQLLKHWSKTKK